MTVETGTVHMAKKKKSETRKHTAMIRVGEKARERAGIAAKLMGMSLADYADMVLTAASDRDINREAKKLTGGS